VTIADEIPGAHYFVVEPSGEQLLELARLVDMGQLRPEIDSVCLLTEARAAFCGQHRPRQARASSSSPDSPARVRSQSWSLVTLLHPPARRRQLFLSRWPGPFAASRCVKRSLSQNSGLTSANSESYSIDHLSEEPGAGAEVETSVSGARQTVAQARTERHVSLPEQIFGQIVTES
jgi:hypothetical protein